MKRLVLILALLAFLSGSFAMAEETGQKKDESTQTAESTKDAPKNGSKTAKKAGKKAGGGEEDPECD